jgi:hypothetical protein
MDTIALMPCQDFYPSRKPVQAVSPIVLDRNVKKRLALHLQIRGAKAVDTL